VARRHPQRCFAYRPPLGSGKPGGVGRGCVPARRVCQVPAIYPGPCDDLPVHPPYAAYLRVYEPLAAFEEAERGWWERYAAESRAPDPRTGPAVERDAGLSRALAGGPWVPGEKDLPEHAYTLDVDGQLLVCPWRTAVRAWAAAGELPDIMPAELALALLPQPQ
jgi:hypothetical protein